MVHRKRVIHLTDQFIDCSINSFEGLSVVRCRNLGDPMYCLAGKPGMLQFMLYSLVVIWEGRTMLSLVETEPNWKLNLESWQSFHCKVVLGHEFQILFPPKRNFSNKPGSDVSSPFCCQGVIQLCKSLLQVMSQDSYNCFGVELNFKLYSFQFSNTVLILWNYFNTCFFGLKEITSLEIDRETVETVRLYFGGFQNHCRW